MPQKPHVFATFPEFSTLSYANRDRYKKLIDNYPAISEISFPTLMTWWSSLENCQISQINSNVIISHWFPGDEKNSGLSLLGTHKIDASICEIFDHLKDRGQEPRLILMPNFVISKMRYPDMFTCSAQPEYDEYIISVDQFSSLEKVFGFKRAKILRFLAEVKEEQVIVEALDLSYFENQKTLLDLYAQWKPRAIINDLDKHGEGAFRRTVQDADLLQQENLCIRINGAIHAFFLYQLPADTDYVFLNYFAFSYEMPGIFEYALYRFARYFQARDVKFINMDIDGGDKLYRTTFLNLHPVDYIRKYIVEPRK